MIEYKPLTEYSNSLDIEMMLQKNNIRYHGFYDSTDGLLFQWFNGNEYESMCVKDGETLSCSNGKVKIR
jgi:hypothetical protein